MTRDNIIFTICGFLLGLVLGSLVVGPRVAQSKLASAAPANMAEGSAAPPEGSGMTPTDSSAMPAATATGGNPMASVLQQIETLKQAIARDPNNFDALTQLGSMYMDAAKFPQAIDYFQRALRIRENANVRTDLGICYKQIGALDKSLAAFQQVTKESPQQWQALFNEVVLLAEAHRFDEAKIELTRLERIRPGDPEVARLKQAIGQMK